MNKIGKALLFGLLAQVAMRLCVLVPFKEPVNYSIFDIIEKKNQKG